MTRGRKTWAWALDEKETDREAFGEERIGRVRAP